jgi:hypothetical protein
MPPDDDGRPSFAEVVQAFTPPGTDWGEFKAAMRQAHQDGGYRPGQVAPDISLPADGPLARAILGGYGQHPSQQAAPADPFSEADAPSVALAEMFHGMIRAGIPVASVESILGKMLAEHGRDFQEKKPGE